VGTQQIIVTLISPFQHILKDKKFHFFLISIIIGLLFYQNYLTPNYSIDDYKELYYYQINRGSMYGRVLVAIYIWFFKQLGINLVASQPFFTIIALLIFSFAQLLISTKLFESLKIKSRTSMILIHILISVSIFNLFTVDLFQFNTYLLGFSLSIFFIAQAISKFNSRNKYNLIIQFIFLSLSVFTYQAWLPYYFIIIPILIITNIKKLKERIFYGVKLFFVYGLASLFNLIWVKYLHPLIFSEALTERLQSNSFFNNLNSVIGFQERLWNDSLLLAPKGLLLLFVFVLFAYMFLKVKYENRIKVLIVFLYLYFWISILVFLPHLFTKEFWPAPRSIVSIMALPSIIPIYYLLIEKGAVFSKIMVLLIVSISIFNLFQINRISYDHLIVNMRDREAVINIYKEILEYEKENGEVEKIIYGAYDPAYCDSDVICSFEINVRAIYVDWAFPYILKMVSGRDFEYKIEMNSNSKEKTFHNNQLVIIL